MIGEFFIDGKPCYFMWADTEPTPVTFTITVRPCHQKPPVRVMLEYTDTDHERKVAKYRVTEATYLWESKAARKSI